ncbi:hypothetical protein BCS42_04460 [Crenothrix sp. D3]|nr:hypothetical protein BCS42_04460 [Crenothrix sp. D3]
MEREFSIALRQLKTSLCFEKCTPENYALLMQHISLQRFRTMKDRQSSKPMDDKHAQLYVKSMIYNNEHLLTEEKKALFLDNVHGVEAEPKQFQGMRMITAIKKADNLCDLFPVILQNKTNRPFIFGDAPVVFINPHLKNVISQGVLGAQAQGLIILYPVGTKHCIMLIDENKYRIKKLHGTVLAVRDIKDVAVLNKLQIHNAFSSIYFSDIQYSEYVKHLWMQEKKKLINIECKVTEIPEYDNNGELTSYLIHSFEPQLPFIPKFSFLDYQELPEENYRFNRRITF